MCKKTDPYGAPYPGNRQKPAGKDMQKQLCVDYTYSTNDALQKLQTCSWKHTDQSGQELKSFTPRFLKLRRSLQKGYFYYVARNVYWTQLSQQQFTTTVADPRNAKENTSFQLE